MTQQFEYKFVRLESHGNFFLGRTPSRSAKETYQQHVHEYARQGWRLVQIFAPGTEGYGMAAYFELIFERPVSDSNGDQ